MGEYFQSYFVVECSAPLVKATYCFIDWVSTSVLAVWAELEKYVPPFLISFPSLCNLQNSASVMKSAYIYHNLGLAVTSSARSKGVPVYQYKDDCDIGQLFGSPAESSQPPSRLLAEAAAYIMCQLLIRGRLFYWHREIAGLMFPTDKQVLISALGYDGCRKSAINDVIKEILCHSRDCNFSIHTFYVPPERNPADEPSRRYSDLDLTFIPYTRLGLPLGLTE